MTYIFQNFNDCSSEILDSISIFIPYLIMDAGIKLKPFLYQGTQNVDLDISCASMEYWHDIITILGT